MASKPTKTLGDRTISTSVKKGRFEISEQDEENEERKVKIVVESATNSNVKEEEEVPREFIKRHSGRFSITETSFSEDTRDLLQSLSLQNADSQATIMSIESEKKKNFVKVGRFEVSERTSLASAEEMGKRKRLVSRQNQEDPQKIIDHLEKAKVVTDEDSKSVLSELSTSTLLVSIFF
jgi:NADH dehydrogenase/NADH:ubiquinone oxidoreductase subunit G